MGQVCRWRSQFTAPERQRGMDGSVPERGGHGMDGQRPDEQTSAECDAARVSRMPVDRGQTPAGV